MIAHTNKIQQRAGFSLIMMVLMTAILSLSFISRGASAYFEFDHDQLWGTIEKTTLSDGRIRHKSAHFENAKIPDSIRAAIEKDDEPLEYDASTMHFSGHYDVTWNPEYKVFKLEDHISDLTKIVCHENGDINMRLSLFGVSVELQAAIKANDDHPVILHAAAKHQCHGQPIFRKIESSHFVAGSDEVLLVTSKAKYEEMWSDADIDISFQHPTITHVNSHKFSKKFDADALDHGADWNAAPTTQGASLVGRNPSLVYRREQADNDEGGLFSKKTGSHFYQIPGYKASNGVITKHESAARKAHAQWGCCKCCKSVTKFVKKTVVKPIKKVAKKAVTAVKGVAKAAGKGIVSAANAIVNLLSISVSMDKTLKHTFSSCDLPGTKNACNKPMIGLLFTFEMKFTTTFRFKFRISKNKLKLFHTALTGALGVGAGARTQSYQDGDGQVKILTIPGPRIKFMISVVPVWIDVTFPILGGVSITYGTKNTPFSAGYDLEASATIGVEWTDTSGFTMLTSRDFTKGYKLDYPKSAPAQINVAPYIGVQARFALYSMIVGYPQIQFGLDNNIKLSANSYCKLRLYSKFFIKLSAGLDLELIIKKITIFHKGFGPWDLYKWSRPVYNYCMRQLPTLPPLPGRRRAEDMSSSSISGSSFLSLASTSTSTSQEEEDQMMLTRDANTLGDTTPPPTTELDPEDSGKIWTSNFTCGDTYYNFEVTGFFGGADNFTFFFVDLSRNVTNSTAGMIGGSNYTLASQSFLAFMDRRVTLGLDFIAVIVEASEETAEQLNMTWDALSDLYATSSGNPNVPSLPLTYINVTFSKTNLDDAVFFNPSLCSGKKMESNESGASESQNVPSKGTFAAQIMERLIPQIGDSFLYLITDTLAIVLSIAVIEIVVIIFLPRCVGQKFFPRRHEEPRYREYVYGIVAVVIGIICYLCFVIGGALQYAEIVGAKVDPNYSPPPPGAPQGDLLTASGVEVIRYEFQGAEISVGRCPQFYPCSPNCRDLCEKRTFKWSNAPWPYCPDSSIITDEPGTTCQPWAWDAIISAVFSFIFLIAGCAIPLIKFSNIYRRMPLSNAFLLLSGMCLSLLQRRIDSFLVEITRDYFGPANDMITPYTLAMSGTSVSLFTTAMTVFWILCGVQGLVTVHELLDYYKQTKDGKIVLHLDDNLMDDIDAQQMKDQKTLESGSISNLNNLQEESSASGESATLKALPITPQYDF